jgi:NAD(P)-dependent dehydrogenase (short-subunit alcohol dehydrogenase family)
VPGELENVDMKGKIVMITGANSGIGFTCAEFLASKGNNS